MSKFTKATLFDREVGPSGIDLDDWQKTLPNESLQTLRDTGSIDLSEIGQSDIETLIQYFLKSPSWPSRRAYFHAYPAHPWQDISTIASGILVHATLYTQSRGSDIDRIAPTYHEKLSKVSKLFGELEEDFDDIQRRITRCAVLEEELADFEDSLEDEKEEYLASCVSLVRDVLDYNDAEDLTQTHLELLKKAVGLICNKVLECSQEDYQNIHREFLQSGLALLPTSQKAIDKYELSKINDGV